MRTSLVAALALLAGCIGPHETSDETSGASPSSVVSERFATMPPSWQPHSGAWSTPGGVLEGRGGPPPSLTDAVNEAAGTVPDAGVSSLVDHGHTYTDVVIDVRLRIVSGEHPDGAGVVLAWKDTQDHIIVRGSVTEDGWHLFTMIGGTRTKQEGATLANGTAPAMGAWTHLRVVQSGDRITASHEGVPVIDYLLQPQDPRAGHAGVFLRGRTVAQFDDFMTALA